MFAQPVAGFPVQGSPKAFSPYGDRFDWSEHSFHRVFAVLIETLEAGFACQRMLFENFAFLWLSCRLLLLHMQVRDSEQSWQVPTGSVQGQACSSLLGTPQ